MNWFPQIGSGSLVQLPLHRRRKWRAIENESESGERISLPDVSAGQIEWRLSYQDLSETELDKISVLYAAARGRFGSFAFADPIANLLVWSEDLARPVWQSGLLSVSGPYFEFPGSDPSWTLVNRSPGEQSLSQTVELSGDYVACFSAFLRSESRATVLIARDQTQSVAPIGPEWKRVFVSGPGDGSTDRSTFSIALAPGQTVEVKGLQLEAQPYPSKYKPTAGESRVYEETYFGADELTVTSTGPGLFACELMLVSRV